MRGELFGKHIYIPLLLKHFIAEDKGRLRCRNLTIDQEVLQALMTYDWPENIRQMQNLRERFCIINDNGRVTMEEM